jgi:hypothetical protein
MSGADDTTGADAGPDRPPAEGGTGTHEVGITEELAEEEQDKEESGYAQGGKGPGGLA